jgi:hypothetical protein
MDDRPDDFALRPQAGGAPDARRARFALYFVPLAVVGVVRQFDAGLSQALWYLAGVAALVGAVAFLRADFFARTSIRVGEDFVRRTGYFGRSASCSRASVARVIEVTLSTSRFGGIPARWLLFLDAHGGVLLRAYAEYYPADDLASLRRTLNVSWDAQTQTRTFAEIRRDLPGSFPWTLAHVWLTTTVILLIGIVGVAVIVNLA